jgi:uncharacterized RDD family membrane protein YckC
VPPLAADAATDDSGGDRPGANADAEAAPTAADAPAAFLPPDEAAPAAFAPPGGAQQQTAFAPPGSATAPVSAVPPIAASPAFSPPPPAAPPFAAPMSPPGAPGAGAIPPGAIPAQGPPTAAPPPGFFQARTLGQPAAFAPPPGAGAPPPGGFQPTAVAYEYGSGAASSAELASPGRRILGYLIDVVILAVVSVPIWLIGVASLGTTTTTTDQFGNTTGFSSGVGGASFFAVLAVLGLVQVLYHVGFVALKGQTPGAMVVKVKVVLRSDGAIPGWGPAFMRWVPNLVSFVPCLGSFLAIGLLIWALVNLFSNPLRQTPYDLAAKTVVIDVS